MDSIKPGSGLLLSSRLAYGCMRIAGDGGSGQRSGAYRAIEAALEAGYRWFDHADIYGAGACEEIFGRFLAESSVLRDDILLASKCGVRAAGTPEGEAPKRYDLSAAYIIESAELSLDRLRTDYLDMLLLHRPDYLLKADEIASAFDRLQRAGKVRHFGVSNFSTSQVQMLAASVSSPLLVHQVEINLHNIDALNNGILDQCQLLGMTPQAWCPLAGVAYPPWGKSRAVDTARLAGELRRQAACYEVDETIVSLAWLLRHPARIMPVIGSTKPVRIQAATTALEIDYSRDDWYRLLEARSGAPVP